MQLSEGTRMGKHEQDWVDETSRQFLPMDRRTALKTLSLTGLSVAAGGIALPFVKTSAAHAATAAVGKEEKISWSVCTVNCGSRCALRMHVTDDVIRWVDTDNSQPAA